MFPIVLSKYVSNKQFHELIIGNLFNLVQKVLKSKVLRAKVFPWNVHNISTLTSESLIHTTHEYK